MGIEIVLLVVALAFVGVTRGSFKNLFSTKINHWWALVPVLIGHLAIEFAPIDENQFDSVGISILLATYVFLFGFMWANLNLKGMWIAMIGLSSNAIVIALNLGMPVTNSGDYSVIETIKHQPATDSDMLGFLGDQIPLNFASIAISIGDIIFAMGLLAVFYFTSRRGEVDNDSEQASHPEHRSEATSEGSQQMLDLTKEEILEEHAHMPAPALQISKAPKVRKSDKKRIAKAEKIAQSRKHKRWQKSHGLAGLPSKEELGYDKESMEVVEVAK